MQDTRGLITREVGLYKIPGVSSHWGGGAIQDTRGLIPLGRWGYTRYQGSHH